MWAGPIQPPCAAQASSEWEFGLQLCHPTAGGGGIAKNWCEKVSGAEQCLWGFIAVPKHIKGVNIKDRHWLHNVVLRGIAKVKGWN